MSPSHDCVIDAFIHSYALQSCPTVWHPVLLIRVKGETVMDTQTKLPAYEKVRELIKSIGGEMRWRPGGGGGGVWELNLRGRTATIEVRDDRINNLDRLYIPQVDNPK